MLHMTLSTSSSHGLEPAASTGVAAVTNAIISIGGPSIRRNTDRSSSPFPEILMKMLDESESSLEDPPIAWHPDGTAFLIHDKHRFIANVLPRYSRQANKYASFTRRLGRWGFVRITEGPCAGGYSHPLFRRDYPALCHQMSPLSLSKGNARSKQAECDPVLLQEKRLYDLENAALSVLSLRSSSSKDESESDLSGSSDGSTCSGQEDESINFSDYSVMNEEALTDDEVEDFDPDFDVASRLKRMAACCRKYDIKPERLAHVQNGGGTCTIKLLQKNTEEPVFGCVQEKSSVVAAGASTGDVNPEDDVSKVAVTMTPDSPKGEVAKRTRAKRAKVSKMEVDLDPPSKTTRKSKMKETPAKTKKPIGKHTKRHSNEVYRRPVPEFGKGWIIVGNQRKVGPHIDKYWYSPVTQKKFRSKAEVRRFLVALKKCKGDEDKAYANMK